MNPDHDEIAACVRIVAKPGRSDDMLDLLTRMAVLAARDEGTEIWAVHRGRQGSGEFFLYELFRDRSAFELHQRNDALNTLGRQLTELADDLVVTTGRLLGGHHPFRATPGLPGSSSGVSAARVSEEPVRDRSVQDRVAKGQTAQCPGSSA